MVGRQALDLLTGVRILSPQPNTVPSSRGLGRGPLKAKTRVRIPLGPPRICLMKIKLYIIKGLTTGKHYNRDSCQNQIIRCFAISFTEGQKKL